MMKDLIIPTKKTDSIDISEITDNFRGVIIVYNGTNPVGYIQYVSGDWNYYESIDGEDTAESKDTLYELIKSLTNIKSQRNFKVIEFV